MNALVLISCLLLPAAPVERATVLIVVGAEGEPEYGRQFTEWAGRWQQAAQAGGAVCVRIGSGAAGDQTDFDRLESILAAEPRESAEPLWLVLIGHGTFDGHSARFNLRGPDVSAAELTEWLKPFKRPVAVINCASASGPFINRLSGAGRVLITATKSGYEYNYARFGDYLSTAIGDPAADLDKDDATSLLEAFLAASSRVAEFYQQEARLATETALLDDNGDGLGTPAGWFRGTRSTRRAKKDSQPDGSTARRMHLIRSRPDESMSVDLRTHRDDLEQVVIRLRDAEDSETNEDEYYAKLEPLLVELARIYAAAEADNPQ